MRVGINFGNALLARRDEASGASGGIAVDLARELARALGTAMELVPYSSASQMADDAARGSWDVAFLAVDPDRTTDIVFTEPYLEIEASYLVRRELPVTTVAEVDRHDVRIAVSERSAYDLFLARTIRRAQLVRAPGVDASVALFFELKLEALAGLKPFLAGVADTHPELRILEGRFTEVRQAIGVARGIDAAACGSFLARAKTSGLIAALVERNNIRGAVIPGG